MATNEEAMSVNEELQSTNEELETSKEELQSLNEELTALNSQLSEHHRAAARHSQRPAEHDGQLGDRDAVPRRRPQDPSVHAGREFACSTSSPRTLAGRSPIWPAASTTLGCWPTPATFSAAACRRTGKSRPTTERGIPAASSLTATRTIWSKGWSSPSPTSPTARRPNGRSRWRGPIPTASSTPFASRSWCSTRNFA